MFHLSIRDFFHMNNLKKKKVKYGSKKPFQIPNTQALSIFYIVDRIKYWEFHHKSILFIFEKKKWQKPGFSIMGRIKVQIPLLSCCDYQFFFFFFILKSKSIPNMIVLSYHESGQMSQLSRNWTLKNTI